MNRYLDYAALPTSTSANPDTPVRSPHSSTQAHKAVYIITVVGALSMPGTSSGAVIGGALGGARTSKASPKTWPEFDTSHQVYSKSQSVENVQNPQIDESNRQAVSELRRLSGLTWDQLAQLFEVSRRSVHFWASGKPLNTPNEEKLHNILAVVRHIDRGSARANRECLVQVQENGEVQENGVSLLELLQQGEFEQVRSIAGAGTQRTSQAKTPLSAEGQVMREPLRPEELIEAIQEPLPQKKKRTRRPKVMRKK